MAGRAKRAFNVSNVVIRHVPSGQFVRQIVHGYVSEPYANHGSEPSVYKGWQAERFVKKWLSPVKAAEYVIEAQ